MKNLLVPIDLSPVSKAAITLAGQLAGPLGAKVWILHVAAPDPDFVGLGTGPQYVRDHRAEVLKKEHVEIQEKAGILRKQGLDSEALLVQGPTSATILDEAKRLEADLIIMGSHGHGALYNTLMGSVVQQVISDSSTPVLIVPSSDLR